MEETVEVVAHDGDTFDGFLYRSPQRSAPGIVMIPEIFGVNQPIRETARACDRPGHLRPGPADARIRAIDS